MSSSTAYGTLPPDEVERIRDIARGGQAPAPEPQNRSRRVGVIRFTPKTDEILAQLEGDEGVDRAELIRRALSMYWWVQRERADGSKMLVQRGSEVTEWVPRDV